VFMGVLIAGFTSLARTIQGHTEQARSSFKDQAEKLEERLREIHALVNSNFQRVKAELEQANLKITSLEEGIVQLGESKRLAEARLKEEKSG
jgi:hypothetical protein